MFNANAPRPAEIRYYFKDFVKSASLVLTLYRLFCFKLELFGFWAEFPAHLQFPRVVMLGIFNSQILNNEGRYFILFGWNKG